MSAIHWKNAASGTFATVNDWNPASVPGAADDAIIDAAGTYTVTVGADATVNTFDTLSGVTLAIAAGKTFKAASGENLGKITVANGGTFEVGLLDNIGSVTLNGSSAATSFEISANTLVGGNGFITLGNNAHNQIITDGTAHLLDNLSETIQGAGIIGDAGKFLTLYNDYTGTISATGTIALDIKTGNVVTNNGVMQATGSGGLHIEDVVNQAGGGVLIANGSKAHIDLDKAVISGGAIESVAGGVFKTVAASNATLFGGVTVNATIDVVDNSSLILDGFLAGFGTIALQGNKSATSLVLAADSILQSSILMSDNTNNLIGTDGSARTLQTFGLISGGGTIGDSHLTLDNGSFATIDATGKAGLIVKAGVVNNFGIMEATGASTLSIQSNITGSGHSAIEAFGTGHISFGNVTIDNTASTVGVLASGAHLDVGTVTTAAATEIDNGSIVNVTGGIVTVGGGVTNSSFTIKDADVINAGTVNVSNHSALLLDGVNTAVNVSNSGTIALKATTDLTEMFVVGTDGVVFSGGGKITLSDNVLNKIGTLNSDTIFENVNNVITGAGTFGDAHLHFQNDIGGVINANGTHALTINAKDGSLNNGLIEATGKGGLVITSDISQGVTGMLVEASKTSLLTISNASVNGGVIKTGVSGATIKLDNGVILGSGNVSTVAGSSIVTVAGTTNNSVDSVHNAGTVTITNNSELVMGGTIVNAGTVNIGSTGQQSTLAINGQWVGHGKIVMTDNTGNLIDTAQGVTVTNSSKLFTFGGTITVGDSLNLNLSDGATFNITEHVIVKAGDTLATLASEFASDINLDLTLAQHHIQAGSAAGLLVIVQPGDTGLSTLITPAFQIGATETISAGGHLSGGQENGQTFENVDNTITGAGQIGHGDDLILKNDTSGIINANGTHLMTIDTGNYDVLNYGTIEATGTGGMKIQSAVLNDGHLIANNSTLDIVGSVTGFGGAQIAGVKGVLHLEAQANFQDITFATGTKGELILDHPEGYLGRIIGFGANTTQSIDLKDINFAGSSETWTQAANGVQGTLHVTDGSHSADLTLVGHYVSGNFTLHDDGTGHVLVTDPPVHGHADLMMH